MWFSNTVLYSFNIVMLFFTLSEIFTQSVDSFQVCNHSLRVKYNMMTLLWVICLTFVWKDQTGRSHFLPMTLRNGLMEWGKILLAESKASALQASKGVWQLKYGVMSRSLWPDQDSFTAHLSIGRPLAWIMGFHKKFGLYMSLSLNSKRVSISYGVVHTTLIEYVKHYALSSR